MSALSIMAACAAMFIIDLLSSLRTVAETRGKSLLAGFLDGNVGLAGVVYSVFGAGSIIRYGWHPIVIVLLVCLYATDMAGTGLGTRLGANIKGNRH
jgi:hypothetical protein